jgi:hypothetical protein
MANVQDTAARAAFDPSTQPQRPEMSLGDLLGEMTTNLGEDVQWAKAQKS